VAYTDPETSAFSPPPPLDPPPSEGKTDGHGWQSQAPNPPQQPYGAYQQDYQPYNQPARGYYAGPMAPATSGYAIASLICSLLGYIGVFGFGPILGIIFGHLALREIDRSNGMLQGRGLAQAGLILGYIALGLALLMLVALVIILVAGAGAAIFAPN
jgi:hypothetical protein